MTKKEEGMKECARVFSGLATLGMLFFAMVTTCSMQRDLAKFQQEITGMDGTLTHVEYALSAESGRALYKKNCAMCHGKNGEGMPSGGVPSLRDGHAKQMTDEELFKKIVAGGNGTGMPPFGKTRTPEEIKDIISHIRELQK